MAQGQKKTWPLRLRSTNKSLNNKPHMSLSKPEFPSQLFSECFDLKLSTSSESVSWSRSSTARPLVKSSAWATLRQSTASC